MRSDIPLIWEIILSEAIPSLQFSGAFSDTRAAQLYPDKEIELQYGGQPIYYYMISAE